MTNIFFHQRFNGINILKGHKGKIQTLHVDYRFIISGSSDHSIRIWNSSNGDLIKMIPTQSEINSMFVIDDRIYAGCADGHIRYWSIQSGECCFDLKGHKAPITDILVWDEKVISVSRDGYMNIFDTNGAGNKLREIPLFETNSSRSKEGNSFSFKRTKENLFVVSTDCKFRIISIKTWDIKYIEFNEKIRCLTVEEQDEDSVKLYMGCGTNIFIYIYNTKTKKLEQIDTLPEFHTENVRNLTVSQKILYSCGFDRVIAIWDLNEKKKKLKYRLTGHEAVVTRIKVLDQKLYSCSEDFSIIMWDLQLLLAPDLFFQSLNQDYLEFYPHDLDEFTSPDFHERNLLMFLCSFGTFECIKSLLHSIHFSQCKSCQNDEECDSKGDELTKTNKYGESGLFFLIKNERWSILSKLAHLIPQKKEFKMEKILNLLKQKAKYDDKEFFKAFTRCNILPDDKIPFVEILSPTFSIRDFPHLTLQFFSGHYNIFDSKNVDKKGRNLLHQACYYGCPKAVEVLLENPHVNVNAEDKDGYTAFRLALFQKSLEDIENAESHVAKQKKELLEKNESNKDLSLPEYFYEGNVGQDLLEGERGVRSVHELLMDRLKCASLILNISEGSKLPRLLLKNKKENRHGYHYLLMRNYDIQQTLKTPRRQIQDAQIIEESNLLFESVTDLVAIANNYPSVQIFRSRFSFTYFCRVAVPYFLWLILLCAMAVMNSTANDSSVYFFSQSIQDSLTNAQFQPLQNWYSIQKPTDFWTYVDGPLLQLLNLEAVLDPSSFKIIGAAEMLQVRVQRDSCPIPSSFQNDGLICYSSSLVQDTSSFGNSQQYHFESNKRAPFTGVQNTYPGSGFIETLPLSTNAYLNLTNNLQVDWIDNQTRAIVITFTLYNVNLNLFGVINLIAEFSSSGELLPTWKFSIIRNHIYFSASEVFLIIFQILTVAYFIYAFPLREIIEFKSKKDKTNYFKDGWNYYEVNLISFTFFSF